MPSPLLDPSPPLGLGMFAILVLMVWGMRSAPPSERGAVARIVGTHVGVMALILAGLSVWMGRTVSPAGDPFIGRVVQIVVSAALLGVVSVIAAKKVTDLGPPAPEVVPADRPERGRKETPGVVVVLGLASFVGALFVFFWLVLSRAP